MDNDQQGIAGKVVIITGASSGLGEATARHLSDRGATVVKPYNLRTTVISPGAVATELPDSITEPDVSAGIHEFYEEYAIPADSFARAVAFVMSQPEGVDINEILFRPTSQEL